MNNILLDLLLGVIVIMALVIVAILIIIPFIIIQELTNWSAPGMFFRPTLSGISSCAGGL